MTSMSSPPGPNQRPSAAPPSLLDDRRSLSPAARPSIPAESTRDVAQEDFLFHLYRGSELLQENRVLEAKEELEFALTMQPLDPKGQDLLGAVYFRVGLYPRAIQIYEGLTTQFPRDVSIKINLALCYLKTGQPEPARGVLQEVVRLNPGHKRAWGYLGLALQKVGDLDQAQIAFERGGHELMARRLTERRQRPSRPASLPSPRGIDEGVRSVAATAFSELDAGELRFALAETEASRPGDGPWHTLELGNTATKGRSQLATPIPPAAALPSGALPPLRDSGTTTKVYVPTPPPPPPPASKPEVRSDLVAPLFSLPPERPIGLSGRNALLVRIDEGQGFACRLDALRVVAGTTTTRLMHRRVRDAETSEVLGGIGSPIVSLAGPAQLALAARPSRSLVELNLDDEAATLREDLVLGFEPRLRYESEKLAFDADGGPRRAQVDDAFVLRFGGPGLVFLDLAGKLAGVGCMPGRPLLVRREWLVGWLGSVAPRSLPAAESPGGQRGVIVFSGEGTVLVCAG